MAEQYNIQRGQQWLEALLRRAGLPASVSIEQPDLSGVKFEEPRGCWLTIEEEDLLPEQVQHLIGSEGVVIDAIQYLINATLNLGQNRELQVAYTIELAGYRARRHAELRVMAEHAASQVRQTREQFEIPALSAAERRLIHTILQEYSDLETYSQGQEPDRRLVVRPLQAEVPG